MIIFAYISLLDFYKPGVTFENGTTKAFSRHVATTAPTPSTAHAPIFELETIINEAGQNFDTIAIKVSIKIRYLFCD
jgi:hypothetical protein